MAWGLSAGAEAGSYFRGDFGMTEVTASYKTPRPRLFDNLFEPGPRFRKEREVRLQKLFWL